MSQKLKVSLSKHLTQCRISLIMPESIRRGEVPSPNGLGDPTPTVAYVSLTCDLFSRPSLESQNSFGD